MNSSVVVGVTLATLDAVVETAALTVLMADVTLVPVPVLEVDLG